MLAMDTPLDGYVRGNPIFWYVRKQFVVTKQNRYAQWIVHGMIETSIVERYEVFFDAIFLSRITKLLNVLKTLQQCYNLRK